MSSETKFTEDEINEHTNRIYKDLDAAFDKVMDELLDITGHVPFAAVLDAFMALFAINVTANAVDIGMPKQVFIKILDDYNKRSMRFIEGIYDKLKVEKDLRIDEPAFSKCH